MTEMGLGHLFDEPTLLLGDNVAAGRWAMEDMITSGNRFIERMYFKVREGVQAGDVEARYINTKLNVSDILTKGAPPTTGGHNVVAWNDLRKGSMA